MTGEVQLIPRALIDPSPYQPRQHFAKEALAELAASIREQGILQPLVLRPVNGRYQCIAGERRLRAAALAGLQKVPALVRHFSDERALELAIVENLQREDLSPVESARAYQRLADEFGYSQSQIAQRTGKSRATVNNTMRLLQLPDPVLELMEGGALGEGHARALLALPTPDIQEELAEWIAQNGLTVREAEEKVRSLQESPNPEPPVEKPRPAPSQNDTYLRDLEDRLRALFGTKASVSYKKGHGAITLEYYSDDDLQRVLELLGVAENP